MPRLKGSGRLLPLPPALDPLGGSLQGTVMTPIAVRALVLVATLIAACAAPAASSPTPVVSLATRSSAATSATSTVRLSGSAAPSGVVLGDVNCLPPSPRVPSPTGTIGILYGTTAPGSSAQLYIGATPVLKTGLEEKLITRMTGSGDLAVVATSGTTNVTPRLIDAHSLGSSYDGVFPGTEWGVFLTFPKAGCWQIHAQRGADAADVWVLVIPRE